MKLDRTRIYSGKSRIGMFTREIPKDRRWVILILIILIFALAACNRPQRASSGAVGGTGTTGTPDTPTPSGDAGGAVLNLERSVTNYHTGGTDFQHEIGVIPLKFSRASEENYLLVEGTGKMAWTETADFLQCGFTAKADVKVFIRGLFRIDDCMFQLTIETEYLPPTTSNQSPDCTFPIYFSETKFTSQIELSPDSSRIKETKGEGWWNVSSVKLTDLKSDVVTNCFVPEVIQRSTATP